MATEEEIWTGTGRGGEGWGGVGVGRGSGRREKETKQTEEEKKHPQKKQICNTRSPRLHIKENGGRDQ